MQPPQHPNEVDRLRELRRYGILDTERERAFDELVEIASVICDVPVSLISFVDEDRQWFKAEVGLCMVSTPIEASMCGHAILQGDFIEIPDTLNDARTADNPLCAGDDAFRFYAGAVLQGASGLPLGTLCILDRRPRTLTDHQRQVLRVLARLIMRELELRVALEQEQTLRREVDHRMKNSLASVGSLLSVKAMREPDAAARHALEEASSLIRSIASLHAELHEIEGSERVNLRSLFGRVQGDLNKLLPEGVTLEVTIGADRATPKLANALVLIVNEFVSNSMKHAFATGGGSVHIAINAGDEGGTIVCRNDGSATPEDAERAATGSGLGTQVIQSLAHSMNGTATWNADGAGMELRMDFTQA